MWGHNHSNQRFCASIANKCIQRSKVVHNSSAEAGGRDSVSMSIRGGVPNYANDDDDPFDPDAPSIGVEQRNPDAPIHMVVGTAGAHFSRNPPDFTPNGANERVLYRHLYARLTATNGTVLQLEWVASNNGDVLDTTVIIQTGSSHQAPWSLVATWSLIGVGTIVVLLALFFGVRRFWLSRAGDVQQEEEERADERPLAAHGQAPLEQTPLMRGSPAPASPALSMARLDERGHAIASQGRDSRTSV